MSISSTGETSSLSDNGSGDPLASSLRSISSSGETGSVSTVAHGSGDLLLASSRLKARVLADAADGQNVHVSLLDLGDSSTSAVAAAAASETSGAGADVVVDGEVEKEEDAQKAQYPGRNRLWLLPVVAVILIGIIVWYALCPRYSLNSEFQRPEPDLTTATKLPVTTVTMPRPHPYYDKVYANKMAAADQPVRPP